VKEYEGVCMRKPLIFGLCLMLAINFCGCSQHMNDTENLSIWAEIYQVTLDSYLKQDTALNSKIDFIAIDLSTLKFANDYDKKAIKAWFERRYVPVIDANIDGLRAGGLFDEENMYITNGVLLTINKVSEINDEIIIEGMKYRGGEAANWFETKWRLINGIWEFYDTVMTAIS
jgi:hypothetical protein